MRPSTHKPQQWLRAVLAQRLSPAVRAVSRQRFTQPTTVAERTMFRALLTGPGEDISATLPPAGAR